MQLNGIVLEIPEGFDDFFSLNKFIEKECITEVVENANIKLSDFTKDKNYIAVFTSKNNLFVEYK